MHRAKHHAFAVLAILALSACLSPESAAPLTPQGQAPTLEIHARVEEAHVRLAPEPRAFAVRERSECAPVESLDVLFIGNSYVIQSDTPGLLQLMADDAGVKFHVDRLAMGGKDFEFHVTRSHTVEKLAERKWDVVFLQSHSLDPLRNPDGFAKAGAELIAAVRCVGAQPWLFETWARQEGHNLYNYLDEVGKSPDEMQGRVTARYEALARDTGVPLAKVGTAWLRLTEGHPEVKPFLKDGAHPAEAGAYLSVAVVFAHLTERDPRGVLQPHGAVDARTAALLQDVAAEVVDPPCAWSL